MCYFYADIFVWSAFVTDSAGMNENVTFLYLCVELRNSFLIIFYFVRSFQEINVPCRRMHFIRVQLVKYL